MGYTLKDINQQTISPFGNVYSSIMNNKLNVPQQTQPVVNMNTYAPYNYQTLANAIATGNYTGDPNARYLTEIGFQNLNDQNSFMNQYVKPGLGIIQGLGTLGSLWLGFKQYDVVKQQLGLAKEQWAKTKEELDRINRVRSKITKEYFS